MPRLVIALIGLLAFAPSAHAVNVTVTTAAGTATPGMVSALIELLAEPGRVIHGDGCIVFGCPVPKLRTEPGETVTIAVDAPIDELTARAGEVTASPRDATTWTLVAPSVPAELNISIRETTATERSRSSSRLMLVGPPPPPPAELVPTQAVIPALARNARLRGRRLTLTVACPAATTSACRGTVTVRANGRTLARTTFDGVAPGARRTLNTTLRKRPRGTVRAVLTAPGAAPVTTRLTLAAREPLLRRADRG